MIRDPSDGTVKETPKSGPPFLSSLPSGESGPPVMAAAGGPDTGLRQPTRTDAQERMEKWRKWLKDYHANKETSHAGADIEQEHSTDGRGSDGEA